MLDEVGSGLLFVPLEFQFHDARFLWPMIHKRVHVVILLLSSSAGVINY